MHKFEGDHFFQLIDNSIRPVQYHFYDKGKSVPIGIVLVHKLERDHFFQLIDNKLEQL